MGLITAILTFETEKVLKKNDLIKIIHENIRLLSEIDSSIKIDLYIIKRYIGTFLVMILLFIPIGIMVDIAEKIDMDISTISRVANSKYVDTPYGTKLIKSFFSEGIKNSDGVEISTIEVKKTLEEIIEQEDKNSPHTDDQLTKLLNKKGYPIARRTVAKYREMIGAPVARLRKKL